MAVTYKKILEKLFELKLDEIIEKTEIEDDDNMQYLVGTAYYEGLGVETDYEEAFKWFSKAAEAGNVSAQTYLGSCYLHGDGTSKNYSKASEWLCKAAEKGDDQAQVILGQMYSYGNGVEKDKEKAVMLWKKAADNANYDAWDLLADCYKKGEVLDKDPKQAQFCRNVSRILEIRWEQENTYYVPDDEDIDELGTMKEADELAEKLLANRDNGFDDNGED